MTNNIEQIENHPVYKQVLADSFGGIMYDVANQGKYEADEVLKLWNDASESERACADGIVKGVIDFLKGE